MHLTRVENIKGFLQHLLAQMSSRQDTGIVKRSRRSIIIAAVILVIAGASWFGFKQIDCKRRNAAFARRIESIKQDAHERLKIGTKRNDVSRFFTEHGIPFTVVESQAIGTLQTSGCAPFGCGTDSALIGVRVKLDQSGTVAGESTVVDLYTDCL
jgi:hypothetical protein